MPNEHPYRANKRRESPEQNLIEAYKFFPARGCVKVTSIGLKRHRFRHGTLYCCRTKNFALFSGFECHENPLQGCRKVSEEKIVVVKSQNSIKRKKTQTSPFGSCKIIAVQQILTEQIGKLYGIKDADSKSDMSRQVVSFLGKLAVWGD